MKNRIGMIMVVLLSLVLASFTPSEPNEGIGITFKHMTMEEARELAQSTGKLVFIDCYTDWCGPCKRMAAGAFKDPEVAALYNKNFINVKIEMEKNPDGVGLARKYKVNAYPTLVFINGQGDLIGKRVGMQSKDALIIFANNVLEKQVNFVR
ncbi:MAG: thioredoxin domain-containing protein [Crocinitomicaceae bacterium]|nr:thioredoxin domain-containing protein [Crocinitomicaceae bacterium]